MNRYPLLSAKNLPAYVTVMLRWVAASVVLAPLLRMATAETVGWVPARDRTEH
jgi:hypothetical protein